MDEQKPEAASEGGIGQSASTAGLEIDCPECNGVGWTCEAVCCGRAHDVCGGRGCTGPDPEQVGCDNCNGTGRLISNK